MWRRGSVIASWLLDLTARGARASRPTSPTSRAGSRTRARAAGRCSPPSTRACPPRCSAPRSFDRFTSRGEADFADKLLSAMRKEFGGHDEKKDAGPDEPSRLTSDALVFFGATGDLAHKKIFPALYRMVQRDALDVPVIGVASSPWTVEQLADRARDGIEQYGGGVDDEDAFQRARQPARATSTATTTTRAPSPRCAGARWRQAARQLPRHPPQPVPDRRRGPRLRGHRRGRPGDRREAVRSRPASRPRS